MGRGLVNVTEMEAMKWLNIVMQHVKKRDQFVIFCKHYQDDLEGERGFAGEGLCLAKNIRVDATDSCKDDFYCFLIDKK